MQTLSFILLSQITDEHINILKSLKSAKSQNQPTSLNLAFPKCSGANGLPWQLSGKGSTCQFRGHRFDPWVRKIRWRRKQQRTLASLPGKYHGHRSLVGHSPCDGKESDMTQQLNNDNTGTNRIFLVLPQVTETVQNYYSIKYFQKFPIRVQKVKVKI